MTHLLATLFVYALWLRWEAIAPRPCALPQPYYHKSTAILWAIGRLRLGLRVQVVALVN